MRSASPAFAACCLSICQFAVACSPEQIADTAGDAGAIAPAQADAGEPVRSGSVQVVAEPKDEAAYLFDATQIRTYNIVIAQSDLDAINAKPSDEAWVPASLEFEGQTYGPYRVRYKGADSAFRYPCTTAGADDPKLGKCSIKLGFNEFDPDARFFGLKKLNLHSMNNDPSQLRDRLSYALYREHGLAAPRAVHARVLINGQLEGLFMAVEQIDGRFTRARFSDGGEGNLYKEIWPLSSDPAEYLSALETNEDENPSVDRMLAFSRAVAQPGADMGSFVDSEYLARYLAVDRVIVNDDGMLHFYCDGSDGSSWNHNFYWYEDGQRFWLIPWDMDLAFDGSPWTRLRPSWSAEAPCSCADSEWGGEVPSSCDPLVKQFMHMQTQYEREVDAFLAGPFSAERIDAKLADWADQIRPKVIEAATLGDAPDESEWVDAVYSLDATITETRKARGLHF